jgi:hypothetical protein
MNAKYLPDDWPNPVHPLYKVPRPLTPVQSLIGEDSPRFFGQVIPSASGPGRLAARRLSGAPQSATRDPNQPAGTRHASLTHSSTPKSSTSQNQTMLEKVMRRSLPDPRFKLAKRSGKGFAIVWAKP